jgi:hypothetical protein
MAKYFSISERTMPSRWMTRGKNFRTWQRPTERPWPLADAIGDVVIEGAKNQNLAVNVRDGLGPVFEVTAVLGSTILRKQ